MKRIDSLLILFSRRMIMLVSLVLTVIGILMLISATTGLPHFMKGNLFFFPVPDLQKEISIDANVWANIPDSSIAVDGEYGKTVVNYIPEFALHEESKKILATSNVYKDTIRTAMAYGKPAWNYKRLSLRTGKLYLEPSGWQQRILLTTPGILWYFVMAFIFWQLAVILKAIAQKDFFATHVYKRVAWIGWSIIAFQIVCILFDYINAPFHSVNLEVSTSIPHYRMPFEISGMPALGYSVTWLFTGAVILVFARAFKYGHFLQDEYDHQL